MALAAGSQNSTQDSDSAVCQCVKALLITTPGRVCVHVRAGSAGVSALVVWLFFCFFNTIQPSVSTVQSAGGKKN